VAVTEEAVLVVVSRPAAALCAEASADEAGEAVVPQEAVVLQLAEEGVRAVAWRKHTMNAGTSVNQGL
jgi:hypothetical protein